MEYSNEELIAMLASNNDLLISKALNYLKQAMAIKVHYKIKGMGGKKEDAEDALNEALFVAYKTAKEGRFKEGSDLNAYIYRVARNYYHTQSRNQLPLKSLDEFLKDIEDEKDKTNEQYEMNLKKLKIAMQHLSPDCQRILILRYFEKKSMGEIMVEFGLGSIQAARNKLHRCSNRLRDIINGK